MPPPTNADIKQSIDALANIPVVYDPDQGINKTSSVVQSANLLNRALYGKTLADENIDVHMLSEKEWLQKTGVTRHQRLRGAIGFTDWDTPSGGAEQGARIGLYIRASGDSLTVLRSLAHEAGKAKVAAIWGFQRLPDNNEEAQEVIKWYLPGLESAGYMNDTAFLRRMEEAGFDKSRYGKTEENMARIGVVLLDRIFITFDQSTHFNAEGKLIADNDGTGLLLGNWTRYFIVANDKTFGDARREFENAGRVNSQHYVRMLGMLAGMDIKDLSAYLRSVITAENFTPVTNWYIVMLTRPLRLDGTQSFSVPTPLGSAALSP